MFAVIRTGGKQYRVTPNAVLKVEKLEAEPGATITFTDVLRVGGEAGLTSAPRPLRAPASPRPWSRRTGGQDHHLQEAPPAEQPPPQRPPPARDRAAGRRHQTAAWLDRRTVERPTRSASAARGP